eukprot:3100284-Heterocapsa_arctica.AAC.1
MKEYLTDDNFLHWITTPFRWWPHPFKRFFLSRISSSIAIHASKTLHSHKLLVKTWKSLFWASGFEPPINACLRDLLKMTSFDTLNEAVSVMCDNIFKFRDLNKDVSHESHHHNTGASTSERYYYTFRDSLLQEGNAEQLREQQPESFIVTKCSFDRTTFIQRKDLKQSDTIGLLIRAKIRAAFGLDLMKIALVSNGEMIAQGTSPIDIFNQGIISICVKEARAWGQDGRRWEIMSWNITSMTVVDTPTCNAKLMSIQEAMIYGPVALQETQWGKGHVTEFTRSLRHYSIISSPAIASSAAGTSGGVAVILPTNQGY